MVEEAKPKYQAIIEEPKITIGEPLRITPPSEQAVAYGYTIPKEMLTDKPEHQHHLIQRAKGLFPSIAHKIPPIARGTGRLALYVVHGTVALEEGVAKNKLEEYEMREQQGEKLTPYEIRRKIYLQKIVQKAEDFKRELDVAKEKLKLKKVV